MVEQLYSMKKYVREGSPALSNKEYFEPVIEKMLKYTDESKLTIKVSHNSENANEDDTINQSFARVLVEGVIHDNVVGSNYTVGMGIALDKNIPEFVSYAGYTVFTCTNLCISADEDVTRTKDNHKTAQFKVFDYLEGYENRKEEFIKFQNSLQNKDLNGEEVEEIMGKMLHGSITSYKNVGSSSIVSGYKRLLDPKSPYRIQDGNTNAWNVYNAITESYSKRFLGNSGLFERPLKTKELTKLTKEVIGLN